MKSILSISKLLILILFHFAAKAQVSINATLGTGFSNYTTVKEAFDKINDGTHKGSIIITIGNTPNQVITETAQATLNKNGAGLASYSDVLLMPGSTNIKVTSALAGACCLPTGTIRLNQSNNVTIDGRIGAAGTTSDLIIENTSSGSWGVALILINASNNIIRYAQLKSVNTSTSGGGGTLSFKDDNAAGGDPGCDNNLVEYCTFSNAAATFPNVAIASDGSPTTSELHDNNIIRNNTIHSFQRFGIWLSGGSTSGTVTSDDGGNRNWIIEGNSIFQPSTFATMAHDQIGICIGFPFNTSSNGAEYGEFVIKNNTIGGNGSGGKWTATSTTGKRIAGIFVHTYSSTLATAGYTQVDGNIISDFDFTSSNTSTDYGLFSGILVQRGKVEIGKINGNIVGKQNTNSIILKASSTFPFASGIHVRSTSDVKNKIMNNLITGIEITAGTGTFGSFYGVRNSCTSTYPQDSICWNNVSYIQTSRVNYFYGIFGNGFISKNRVRDIDFTGAASFSEIKGITWYGGYATGSDNRGVENNEIILGKNKAGASIASNNIIIGIHVTRGDVKVFHNSVLIEGAQTGSENTIALLVAWSGTIEVKNNALYNERSGGTGKHYAISRINTGVAYTASNNAYVIGTGANNLMGVVSASDKATLANWTATPIAETVSLFDYNNNQPVNLLFPLIAQDSLAIPNSSWLIAGVTSEVTTDIRNVQRDPIIPAIGAYEPIDIVALPIELLFFDGQTIKRKNLIQWATVTEWNTDVFILERSENGFDWEYIELIPAAGYSNYLINYSVWDNKPYNMTYYRLKQYDKDGALKVLGPITLELEQQNGLDITLFPNPVSDYIYLSISDKQKKDVIGIFLYSYEGKLVRFHNYLNDNVIHVEDLPSGIYLLNVKTTQGEQTFKVKIGI